jgi:hypothetical protein
MYNNETELQILFD